MAPVTRSQARVNQNILEIRILHPRIGTPISTSNRMYEATRATTAVVQSVDNNSNLGAINGRRPRNQRNTNGNNHRAGGIRGAPFDSNFNIERFYFVANDSSTASYRISPESYPRFQRWVDHFMREYNLSNEDAYNTAVNEYNAQRVARSNTAGVSQNVACLDSRHPLKCNICLNPYRNREPTAVQCGHIYCRVCIERHIEKANAVCVVCNADISGRLVALFI